MIHGEGHRRDLLLHKVIVHAETTDGRSVVDFQFRDVRASPQTEASSGSGLARVHSMIPLQ